MIGRYGLRFLTALSAACLAMGAASCGLDEKINELVNPPAQKTVPTAAITVDSETIPIGKSVYLSGADSSDPQGKSLTYAWTLQVPSGSAAVLSSATTVTASFTPDKTGEYLVSLTVTNSSSVASGTVTLKLTAVESGTNIPPVAVTTGALTGTTDSAVVLDASGSYDDDQTLTYTWTLLGAPSASALTEISDSGSVTAYFIPDVVGAYTIKLVVSDGQATDDATVTVTVTTQTTSTIPVASFTASYETIKIGTPVLLDASASYDPQDLDLTYTWNIEVPKGSSAALGSTSAVVTQFTPDVGGIYVVYLKVTNSSSTSSSTVTRNVSAVGTGTNYPPVAITTTPLTGTVGAVTFLDGSQSYDADQQALAYAWTLISAPSGSALTAITNNTLNIASFTPDAGGTYIINFTVSDGSDSDQITVTARISAVGTGGNQPPVAITDTTVTGALNVILFLDGSQSYDYDQDALTYSWTILSVPAGSAVTILNDNTSKKPYFTPDIAGEYLVKFTVSDGTDNDVVYVTVTVA